MDIKDFAARRNKLEKDIRDSCIALVNEFYSDTSINPSNISIDLIEVTAMCEEAPCYAVGQCKVDCNI